MGFRLTASSLAAFVVWSSACSPEPRAPERLSLGSGVLIIEIDGWRKDHLSLYGYEHPTTPNLDRWSQQAWVFEDAWSTGSGVLPASASLLSGCDSILSRHPGIALRDGEVVAAAFPWQFPPAMPLLAFEFLAQGWRTGLFDGTGRVNELRGVHLGFETLEQVGVPGSDGVESLHFEQLAERWERWLVDQRHGSDWFAYWHVADLERFTAATDVALPWPGPQALNFELPVASVDPAFHALPKSRQHPEWRRVADLVAGYDAALLRLDARLGAFFETLEDQRLLGRTTVILVGGYGMGFGEAGLFADAGTLSEADLAVPLIIRPARDLGLPVGLRVPGLASLADVAPTALELARIAAPAGWQGRSLMPLWRESQPVREYAYAVADLHAGFAVIDERGLFVHAFQGDSAALRLGETWSGSKRRPGSAWECLLTRGQGLRPYAYRLGLPDDAWAQTLRTRGKAWEAWGTRLASQVHPFAVRLPSLGSEEAAQAPSDFDQPEWAR